MQSEGQAPIKVGIIGVGGIADAHLRAYKQYPQVQIVALADTREDRLAQVAEQYNVANTYTNYEDLVQQDDIDIVSVCTPNFLHAPASIAALKAGKHVLCEKPLARSASEGEAMVRAALEARRVLKVSFNHRARGDVQVLKRQIDAGSLGRVYHAKATWMRRAGIPGWGQWFFNQELAGGGPLIDLGVHVLDMAMFLMGDPEVLSVSAATYSELGPRGRGFWNNAVSELPYEVEDLATAFIRLADGSTLNLEASWAVYGRNNDAFGVTLYGTEGGADIDIQNYATEDTLAIYSDFGGVPAETRPRVAKGDGHTTVVGEFLQIIESGDWSNHVGRDALKRTYIIDACYRSAREGREILISEIANL